MLALKDRPVSLDIGARPEQLFDPGGRTLDDLLRETDDALRHGRAAACLVCGAMTTVGGELSTPAECTSCGSRLE
jgi:hypothetical protein